MRCTLRTGIARARGAPAPRVILRAFEGDAMHLRTTGMVGALVILGSGTESMGLLVEGFRAGRMVGTATILPAKSFAGRFEAIHE